MYVQFNLYKIIGYANFFQRSSVHIVEELKETKYDVITVSLFSHILYIANDCIYKMIIWYMYGI